MRSDQAAPAPTPCRHAPGRFTTKRSVTLRHSPSHQGPNNYRCSKTAAKDATISKANRTRKFLPPAPPTTTTTMSTNRYRQYFLQSLSHGINMCHLIFLPKQPESTCQTVPINQNSPNQPAKQSPSTSQTAPINQSNSPNQPVKQPQSTSQTAPINQTAPNQPVKQPQPTKQPQSTSQTDPTNQTNSPN